MLLSIVIPAYGRADTLRRALDTFISQVVGKYEKDVEIIVVDDASPGDPLAFAAAYAQQYDFMQYHRYAENIGLERNLVACTKFAKGEFLWLFGDDDYLETPDALDEVITRLRRNDADFFIFNRTRRNKDLSKLLTSNWMELSGPDHRYSGLREFYLKFGYLSVIGFISVNVFRRAPYVAIDASKYLGTMYPQLGAMTEAFHSSPTVLVTKPLVCHRTQTPDEKKAELGKKATEADFMADSERRNAIYFSHPHTMMLDILISKGAMSPDEIVRIPENTVIIGPLIEFLVECIEKSLQYQDRFTAATWRRTKGFFDRLPLTQAHRARVDAVYAKMAATLAPKMAAGAKPLTISVVSPSFNQAEFLGECLQSVRDQSYPAIEHFVFDPGSKDGSREIAKTFPHVTLCAEPDKGQSDAINKGWSRVKGDIVAWLNSDDMFFDGDVFQKVVDRFNAPDAPDIVYGKGIYINEQNEKLRDIYINKDAASLPWKLQQECGISQPALFMRRSVIERVGKLTATNHFSMDYEYWIRCAKAGIRFAYVDQDFSIARYHTSNKTYGQRGKSYAEVCEMLLEQYGYVSRHWLRRYAEFIADGHDGVLAHGGNAGARDPQLLEREYDNLLLRFNCSAPAYLKLWQNQKVKGYEDTYAELQARGLNPERAIGRGVKVESPHTRWLASAPRDRLPTISLVTPNYNSVEFIDETMRSVLQQEYPKLQYVVVDAVSTDGSQAVIEKYRSQLHGYTCEKDNGHSDALNKGFAMTNGEIMGWINSDDVLLPDSLAAIAEVFAKHPEVQWITGRPTTMGGGEGPFKLHPLWKWSRPRFMYGNYRWIQQESTFWRRSLWEKAGGKLDVNTKLACDLELWTRFFRHAELHSFDHPLGVFRVRPGQRSAVAYNAYEAEAVAVIQKEFESLEPDFLRTFAPLIGDGPKPLTTVQVREVEHKLNIADTPTIDSATLAKTPLPLPTKPYVPPRHDTFEHVTAPDDLVQFKDIHKGKRCFVMGNGPSLNKMDLSSLEGEFVFGCNSIFLLFDRVKWRPAYYTCVDSRVLPDRAAEIEAMLRENPKIRAFFPTELEDHVAKVKTATRALMPPRENISYFRERWNSTSNPPHSMFSLDINQHVIQPYTVAITMLQIAAYMGFSEIYLIGCDTSYRIPDDVKKEGLTAKGEVGLGLTSVEDNDPNHFDPRYFGKGRKWHDPQTDKMIEHYGYAKRAVELKGGTKIYNATVGGNLEVFERIEFTSLFGSTRPKPAKTEASTASQAPVAANGADAYIRPTTVMVQQPAASPPPSPQAAPQASAHATRVKEEGPKPAPSLILFPIGASLPDEPPGSANGQRTRAVASTPLGANGAPSMVVNPISLGGETPQSGEASPVTRPGIAKPSGPPGGGLRGAFSWMVSHVRRRRLARVALAVAIVGIVAMIGVLALPIALEMRFMLVIAAGMTLIGVGGLYFAYRTLSLAQRLTSQNAVLQAQLDEVSRFAEAARQEIRADKARHGMEINAVAKRVEQALSSNVKALDGRMAQLVRDTALNSVAVGELRLQQARLIGDVSTNAEDLRLVRSEEAALVKSLAQLEASQIARDNQRSESEGRLAQRLDATEKGLAEAAATAERNTTLLTKRQDAVGRELLDARNAAAAMADRLLEIERNFEISAADAVAERERMGAEVEVVLHDLRGALRSTIDRVAQADSDAFARHETLAQDLQVVVHSTNQLMSDVAAIGAVAQAATSDLGGRLSQLEQGVENLAAADDVTYAIAAELAGRVAGVEAGFDDLSKTARQSDADVRTHLAEVVSRVAELRPAVDAIIARVHAESLETGRVIHNLDQRLSPLERGLDKLFETSLQGDRKIGTLSQQLEKLESAGQDLVARADANEEMSRQDMERVTARLEIAESKFPELVQEIRQSSSHSREWLTSLTDRIAGLRSDVEGVTARIDATDSERDIALAGLRQVIEGRISDLDQKAALSNQAATRQDARLSVIDSALSDMGAKLRELSSNAEELRSLTAEGDKTAIAALDGLESRVTTLGARLETLASDAETARASANETNATVSSALAGLETKVVTIGSELAAIGSDAAAMRLAAGEAGSVVAEIGGKVVAIEASLAASREANAGLEQRVQVIGAELAEASQLHQQRISEVVETTANLAARLSSVDGAIGIAVSGFADKLALLREVVELEREKRDELAVRSAATDNRLSQMEAASAIDAAIRTNLEARLAQLGAAADEAGAANRKALAELAAGFAARFAHIDDTLAAVDAARQTLATSLQSLEVSSRTDRDSLAVVWQRVADIASLAEGAAADASRGLEDVDAQLVSLSTQAIDFRSLTDRASEMSERNAVDLAALTENLSELATRVEHEALIRDERLELVWARIQEVEAGPAESINEGPGEEQPGDSSAEQAAQRELLDGIASQVASLGERVADTASVRSEIDERVRAVEEQVRAERHAAAAISERFVETAQRIEAAERMAAFDNSTWFQRFNRRLLDSHITTLEREWARKLSVQASRPSLGYMAARAVEVERELEGRLATSIEDVLLRTMVARATKGASIDVLEIGTLFGVGAAIMYDGLKNHFDNVRFTLLDPLEGYYSEGRPDILTGEPVTERVLRRNLARAGMGEDQVRVIQRLSTDLEAISAASDRLYDVLVIDADHSYGGVKADFENYGRMVKLGGYVIFDDYGSEDWPDVKAYVDAEISSVDFLAPVGTTWRTSVFRVVKQPMESKPVRPVTAAAKPAPKKAAKRKAAAKTPAKRTRARRT